MSFSCSRSGLCISIVTCKSVTVKIFDITDTVESLTPQRMRGIRVMLNASAMDILYYTSPLYRSEVSVSENIHNLFL